MEDASLDQSTTTSLTPSKSSLGNAVDDSGVWTDVSASLLSIENGGERRQPPCLADVREEEGEYDEEDDNFITEREYSTTVDIDGGDSNDSFASANLRLPDSAFSGSRNRTSFASVYSGSNSSASNYIRSSLSGHSSDFTLSRIASTSTPVVAGPRYFSRTGRTTHTLSDASSATNSASHTNRLFRDIPPPALSACQSLISPDSSTEMSTDILSRCINARPMLDTILVAIMHCLSGRDLAAVASTCKAWRQFVMACCDDTDESGFAVVASRYKTYVAGVKRNKENATLSSDDVKSCGATGDKWKQSHTICDVTKRRQQRQAPALVDVTNSVVGVCSTSDATSLLSPSDRAADNSTLSLASSNDSICHSDVSQLRPNMTPNNKSKADSCPRCMSPADVVPVCDGGPGVRAQPSYEFAVCSRSGCGFSFCVACRCSDHGVVAACRPTSGSPAKQSLERQRRYGTITSVKSRRRLRRL